jgi:hypothetical protein
MTKDDWKKAESKLSYPYGRVEFLIDGYNITVIVVQEKAMKYVLAVYVDGKIDFKCVTDDCEVRRKFYFESRHSLLDAKQKKKLSRERKSVREAVLAKSEYTTYRSLKSKFVNNNSSIELIK